ALGNVVVADRRGPAIRERRGADGLLRIGAERYHSFPQSVAARGTARRRPGYRGGARHRACWSALDFDVGRIGVRLDRNGVLRSAVASPVWLVERVRHAGGLGGGPVDPAAHSYGLEQARAPVWREATAPPGFLGREQLLKPDRQLSDPNAGRMIDRVGD